MKRFVGIILSLVLIMSMVLSIPFNVGAITIEEIDKENALSFETNVYDFEEEGVIKVGSQSLSDEKVSWQIDFENTLEYYYSGWGFSHIADNPVKTATTGKDSIVNASNKVLGAQKTTYNHWSTGGGFVINNVTNQGVKPYILENNTTYTVEFDYLIESTHLYGEITKPDGTTMTIGGDAVDALSLGYGYKENTDNQLGAVAGYNTLIEQVASYKASRDVDGTFTAFDGVKEVGNWYHYSVTFKTGNLEDIYSKNNAPFLILYANLYTGAAIYVDNFSVGKTQTNAAIFDFEDKDYMYLTSQSFGYKKCEWQVDPLNKIEYYVSGWGFTYNADNPVKSSTGVNGSVVNPSEKGMRAQKTSYNRWGTSGGNVINRKTEKGIEPVVLEDNTTYTIEFDYLVYSTHIYGDYINPSDGTQTGTISTSAASIITFGYGYKVSNQFNANGESTGVAPVNQPQKNEDVVVTYRADWCKDGTYKRGDAQTSPDQQVGSWYHYKKEFTTGTFDSIFAEINTKSNLPFLMFYTTLYTGDYFMIDNIRLIKHVDINLNANGGTVSDTSVNGVMGDKLSLPTPSKMGYEFTGWYKDGVCTIPFTDRYLTKENAGTTIYAGWKMGIEGFENYSFSGNGSKFSVSADQAYKGTKSIKYNWTKATLDFLSGRTNENHYFGVRKLTEAGTYKMTFRYYISGSANVTVYPVLVGNSNSNTVTKPTLKGLTSLTLNTSAAGRWQTMSIVFTTASSISSSANNLALHMHAASNAAVTVYVDEVKVEPVKSDASIGSLSANGVSVGVVNGDVIDNGFVYKNGYAVEGWYSDQNLTQKIPANVYKAGTTAAYPKFSDKVDLTANGITSLGKSYKHTGDFAEAGYNDSLSYSGETGSGKAKLVNAAAGTYMVEFLYKNKGCEDVAVTIGSGTSVLIGSKYDKWYSAYVPVTVSSAGILEMSLSGKSVLEIKDVHIKDISGKVYVLFDSTEFGGELTCAYGTAGATLTLAESPIIDGKQFSGWYNGSSKFTSNVFPNSSVVLKAKMAEAGQKVKGDCDGDGVCSAVDVAKLKLYLAKIDTKVADGADINNDGKVNAIDLVLLYNILAGK